MMAGTGMKPNYFYMDGKKARADVIPLKAGNYDDMEPLKPTYKPKPGDECRTPEEWE